MNNIIRSNVVIRSKHHMLRVIEAEVELAKYNVDELITQTGIWLVKTREVGHDWYQYWLVFAFKDNAHYVLINKKNWEMMVSELTPQDTDYGQSDERYKVQGLS